MKRNYAKLTFILVAMISIITAMICIECISMEREYQINPNGNQPFAAMLWMAWTHIIPVIIGITAFAWGLVELMEEWFK